MIHILLVEDHHLVRDGISTLLANEPDLRIQAVAADGREALDLLDKGLEVTVVLTDINMPELDGIDLASQLQTKFPLMKIVFLTMLDHEDYLQRAFKVGAVGYLLKTVTRDELLFAIRHVAEGNTYICSEISYKLLKKSSSFYIMNEPEPTDANLSVREKEILELVVSGMTNHQIADKLFTSRRTVEGHRQKLLAKTRTKNTAELIRYAIQHGIFKEKAS